MIVANKFKIKSILIFHQLFGKVKFHLQTEGMVRFCINQNIICTHAVVNRIKSRVSASNRLLKRLHTILSPIIDKFYSVTFCLCIYFLKANFLSSNIPIFRSLLTRIFVTPNILKMCNPILITVLKMQPHYSQRSHENKTPSSDTSPSASSPSFPPRLLKIPCSLTPKKIQYYLRLSG